MPNIVRFNDFLFFLSFPIITNTEKTNAIMSVKNISQKLLHLFHNVKSFAYLLSGTEGKKFGGCAGMNKAFEKAIVKYDDRTINLPKEKTILLNWFKLWHGM